MTGLTENQVRFLMKELNVKRMAQDGGAKKKAYPVTSGPKQVEGLMPMSRPFP